MKQSARYVKIVEWSQDDECYVGICPGLFLGGCHETDERAVFAELCDIRPTGRRRLLREAALLHRAGTPTGNRR